MAWLLKAAWWGAKFIVKTYLWVVAHPVAAIFIGGALVAGSVWLANQPWAGADVLAAVVGLVGLSFIQFGIGAWISMKVLSFVPAAAARHIGAVMSWWWYPQRIAHGYLPFP